MVELEIEDEEGKEKEEVKQRSFIRICPVILLTMDFHIKIHILNFNGHLNLKLFLKKI